VVKRLIWAVVGLFALIGAAAAIAVALLLRGGIGARAEPGALETAIARPLRSLGLPRDARDLQNPIPATAEALADGRAHFADHCAICHANDGSGDTEIGRALYPRAPDMRARETQALTDGQLFYIIENGVRFTGMPGWGTGTPEGTAASWHLVHFIRRLPQLSPEELEEMAALNPRSAAEWREEEEARRFLEGGSEQPDARPHEHGGHK
jgi:mono/diheme cytochrome c family protein